MNEFVSWCSHLLVSFLFHAQASLHPPSFHRNAFSTCIHMARRFNNTIRYIDDLLVLNNTNFSDAIQDIYYSELQLKKTTESTTALSYLDIYLLQ